MPEATEQGPERLGLGKTIVFSFAQFGGNLLSMIFTSWILFFYTDTAKKGSHALVGMGIMGFALAAGRVVDAFYDPTIGYWSDNTMTKWGRRRPFIVAGLPFYVISFILLFNPLLPAGSTGLAVLTVILISIFWLSFTTVMGPYNALMPEIAVTSQERVFISTLLALMMLVATGYQGIVVPMMVDKWGMGYYKTAVISGLIAFVFIVITVVTVKEKISSASEQLVKQHEKYSVKDAFVWTFTNKPFLFFVLASVFQYLGFSSLTASIPFIVKALMNKPVSFVGTVYMFNIPAFVISFVAVNYLAKKTGKVRLYKVCLFLLALLLPLLYFIGDPRVPFSPVTTGIALMTLLSFPIAGNMVLPTAILADIIDYDEKLTNRRREAIYFGMQGLLQKMANALSQGMQALLFSWFGYTAAKHLGINLLGPVAGFLGLIGFIVFLFFPLDEKTKDLKVKST
jgi:glycoside/pentoside/hexuronide:cation symporter, GPH family